MLCYKYVHAIRGSRMPWTSWIFDIVQLHPADPNVNDAVQSFLVYSDVADVHYRHDLKIVGLFSKHACSAPLSTP